MGTADKSLALLLALVIALSSLLYFNFMPDSVAQNGTPSFTVSIDVSINNYSSTCIFGVNPDSTTDYSPQFDSIASRPSSGVYPFFRCPNQTIVTQKLTKFIIPSNGYSTWFLEVDSIDQYGSVTLAWNDTSIPKLTLEDGASKQIYANMNTVNNFSFSTTPGSIRGFIIVYQSPGAPSPTPSPTPFPSPSPTSTLPPSVQIPTPSVPQYTIKFVNSSYEVPTSYSTDPFTGQNVTHPGYYVENSSIVLKITNQPFVSFIDTINGAPWNISLFIDVQMKGHFSENWTSPYSADLGYLTQSNSEYTIMIFPVVPSESSQSGYDIENYYPYGSSFHSTLTGIASDGQVDFRVQVMIGYVHRVPSSVGNPFFNMPWVFDGQTSAWSNTQTITLPAGSSSTSPSPTPTVPEFSWLAILPLFVSLLFVAVIIIRRKPNT
jgi:hypothetical protein